MKQRMQGMVVGFLVAVLILVTATAFAATTRTIEVTYGVNIVVDGIPQTFAVDSMPFTSGGRTFLPVRGIADALGLDVSWDGATSTVFINSGTLFVPTPMPTPVPTPPPLPVTREVTLFNRPFTSVGNAHWFNAGGDAQNNHIRLFELGGQTYRPGTHSNYVVYTLGYNSAVLRATLNPPNASNSVVFNPRPTAVLIYRFYGDGVLLYESPSLGSGSPPIPIEINVNGINQLRIEKDVTVNTNVSTWSFGFLSSWMGVENAVITITEYQ